MKRSLIRLSVRAIALVLGLVVYSNVWADFDMENPVTSATESYTYKFIGTDSVWNNAANWQDANGSNPSAVPAASDSNTWAPILFDQAENQSIGIGAVLSVEGWNLRMGLYNGASVTLRNLVKLQSDTATWITVDSSSHCTIEHMVNKKLAGANPLCLYSANEGGIAWTEELSSSGNEGNDTPLPFHYYLAGNGTVAYNGGIAAAAGGAHVIKQADITLSGAVGLKKVYSKTLVSFASSSTSTFSADATINVKNSSSEVVSTVNLSSINTTGETTLTTSDPVGECELVKTSTSIDLYWVDNSNDIEWTGLGGDNLWSNSQNWSSETVPTASQTAVFGSETYEVGIAGDNSTVEVGAIAVAAGGKVTFRHNTSDYSAWPSIKVCSGHITGSGGTVVLKRCGLKGNAQSPSLVVDCNLEFLNDGSNTTTHDSWIEGATFTINGNITGTGLLKLSANSIINGNLTVGSGAYIQLDNVPTFGTDAVVSGSGWFIVTTTTGIDRLKPILKDAANWEGTCELRGISISALDFADYANENSYVCANGLSGTFKGSGVCRIADGIKGLKLTGNGLTVGGWSTGHTYVIAADISGAGPINLNIQSNAGNPLNAPASIDKVVFTGSTSDFTGQVSFKQNSYRPCYIFANESDLDSLPTPTDYGQIIVMAGKTVNVGSVWTAAGGFLINGEADTKSSSAYLSGTVLGNGTVKAAYTHSSGALRAPNFGNASENTFEITGMTAGWISNASANGMPNINATVKLSGNVTIKDGYGANSTTANVTTFKRLTGSGNLTFSFATGNAYANYTISTINGALNANNPYTGTITANNKARVVIGVVDVDEVPLDGRRLVGIANSNRDRFVNASGTAINNSGLIDVTVGGVADTAKLYADTDGLYVAIAQVGDTYYKSLRAAADAARAADTTFTRVYAGAGDTYPGWTYSDGVFTYDNKVVYNATKDVAYATLQDAITASSAEDIIQLLEANSETAVDTTDKDFFFDENGYAFGGTWTGSGRIVLSAAPSTTTWSSAKFVADGWTGTVALDWKNIVSSNELPDQFNKYGISGSMVEIGPNGSASGYLSSTPNPKLKINGSLEIKNGSSNNERTISYITGNGSLTFTKHYYGGDTTNYKVTTLENWNGVITNTSPAVAITTIQSGTGVIYTSTAFKSDPTANAGWQGRVVLDYANIVSASDISGKFNNKYGVSGSIVEIGKNGTISGNSHFGDDFVPNLKVSGFVSVNDGSSTTRRVIPQISGDGVLVFGNKGAQVNYTVSNLVNWDGIITNKAANVRFVGFSSGNGVIVHDWTGSNSPYILSGHVGSRVVINKSGSGHLASGKTNGDAAGNANFEGTLELAEGVTLTVNNGWYNSNVSIGALTGKGNLTVANTTHRWTGTVGYNIGTIDADSFTGTLTVGNEFNIGITKITRSIEPASGVPYIKAAKTHADLASSTDGFFNVGDTTVEIGGEATSIKVVYGTIGEQSGLYKAVAQVNTTYYATIQEAINAAEQAGGTYTDVTILDATAECPDGYYVDTNDNDTLKMYQAALVDTDGEKHYFYTPQAAVDAIAQYLGVAGTKAYSYYEVYYGENVAIAIDTSTAAHAAWAGVPLKIKCLAGASVAVTLASTESELTAGTADEDGIVTYTKTDKATTYVWAGATSDSASTSKKNYARADNWKVGTSSGATATRAPGSLDTVVFENGAYASTTASQSVAALQVSGTVTIIGGGSLTSASAITLGTGDSITITGTLSPEPTTTVSRSRVVSSSISAGTTTYRVEVIPGTIFLVY